MGIFSRGPTISIDVSYDARNSPQIHKTLSGVSAQKAKHPYVHASVVRLTCSERFAVSRTSSYYISPFLAETQSASGCACTC